MSKISRIRFDQIINEDWGFIRISTEYEPIPNGGLCTYKYTSFMWDLWVVEYQYPTRSIVRYQLVPRDTPPSISYTPVDESNFEGVLEALVKVFVYESA